MIEEELLRFYEAKCLELAAHYRELRKRYAEAADMVRELEREGCAVTCEKLAEKLKDLKAPNPGVSYFLKEAAREIRERY